MNPLQAIDNVTMPGKPFGVLLVGGAQSHLENYGQDFADDPRCRLIALSDEPEISARQQRLNQQLANHFQIPYWKELENSLQNRDIDVVVICVEPERRARLAIAAARAGKQIYLDKPMCTQVAEAAELLQVVEEEKTISQMFSLIRHPLVAKARAALERPDFGKLIGLHCELMFAKGTGGTADLSQPRTEKEGPTQFSFIDSKRELFCVGLYPLVLFEWLMKSPAVAVYAQTSNYFFREHHRNDVEDFSMLQLTYANGVEATITVGRSGWASHPSHGIHQLDLVGSGRMVSLDAFEPRLEVYSDAPPWRPPEEDHPEDPMGFWSSTVAEAGVRPKQTWQSIDAMTQSDASYFLDCLEKQEPSDVPVELGAHVIQVFQAAYASAALGEVVEIDPL
ncbi:putative oxidoreductase [Polystyrenella longa]|uniref:Putative oxidoreductase n=1 Tax=Polystyrenella longa TaxID=2528007 RepID=A0A518CIH8_9PLAN|nr:Gfo/Idh/MocA family oxidoreductase [Polystyrenella longa]QDU79046.1 putative oxidoreductase [Polystyrenella longa]